MNNNKTSIIIFILAFISFLALRVYAASASSGVGPLTVKQADANEQTDSSDSDIPVEVSASGSSAATVSGNGNSLLDAPIEVDKSLTDNTLSGTGVPSDSDNNSPADGSTDISDNDTSSDNAEDSDDDYDPSNYEDDGNFATLTDAWHGDFTPIHEFKGDIPRIVCWGDSLTESIDHKTAYPDVLADLTGCEVLNYGVSSETTKMIAMRQGGIGIIVSPTVIPSTCEMIPIFINSETDDSIFLLDYGDAGINECSIDGISGTLRKLNGSYYFTRSEEGARTSIEEGTPLVTFAANDASPSDVLILFTGTNDKPNPQSIYEIIDVQRKMIEASGSNKYIVVGLTYNAGITDISAVNSILANEYGDHFIDIRTYLLTYGLEDAGIKATSTDMIDKSKGDIPSSLMRDYVHGNSHYFKLLAQQIYRRLIYLGYLPNEN